MDGMYRTVMGDRGRLVVPAELRERTGLSSGTPLTVVETSRGIVLLTQAQLRDWVRQDLADLDLVSELLDERRAEAAADIA